jgi:hypothetical protein
MAAWPVGDPLHQGDELERIRQLEEGATAVGEELSPFLRKKMIGKG